MGPRAGIGPRSGARRRVRQVATEPTAPGRADEPDFDDEDEAAMDRVYVRLDAGESLDDVTEIDDGEDES